jgi:Domain of unknown function (DUF4194)
MERTAGQPPSTPDKPFTPRALKDAVLELLKYGFLEESHKPNLYRSALSGRDQVARALEPLDLAMKVDEIRGLAFVVVAARGTEPDGDQNVDMAAAAEATDDPWSHPLVRRQRLNLEQSLLIAILRQFFVANEQEAGIGSTGALVSLDDILPYVQTFLGDLGSDVQEQKRLRTLLEQLKGHGIVSDVDQNDQLFIRPIIAHVANPENLQNLLKAFRAEADRAAAESKA